MRLEWSDINFDNAIISITKASQRTPLQLVNAF